MSEYQEPVQVSSTATPRWVGIALVVLAAVSLLGIGIGWSALTHANSVEQTTQTSVRQANEALTKKLAKEDEINQQLESDLKVVTEKLNATQSDLVKPRKQNRQSSVTIDKKIAGLENSVNTQLAAKASADDVNKLNTDVTGVRSDLDAAKNNLQMARSEMGTLIARNHDEIDQLRRMGTRDYFEFTVTRKAGAQKVGAVQVELKNANPKKNQVTINVFADDKTFEKKNPSVHEPNFLFNRGGPAAPPAGHYQLTKYAASGHPQRPLAARRHLHTCSA